MSYLRFLADLPADIQKPMAHLLEAFQEEMRSQFVVSQEQRRGLQNLVVDLAESQRRTDERMRALFAAQEVLTQSVRELTEAQRDAEKRIARLETAVADLTESHRAVAEAVRLLIEAQRNTETRLDRLDTVLVDLMEALSALSRSIGRFETGVERLVRDNLERKYRERAFSYLGPILRPIHVVSLQDLLPRLETHLTEEEMDRLLPLDLLLHGRVRHLETKPEVWLAMEVSGVVNQHDVERAVDRARLLTKAGLPAIPAVAGEDLDEGIARLVSEKHVFVLLDGQRLNWYEALAAVVDGTQA